MLVIPRYQGLRRRHWGARVVFLGSPSCVEVVLQRLWESQNGDFQVPKGCQKTEVVGEGDEIIWNLHFFDTSCEVFKKKKIKSEASEVVRLNDADKSWKHLAFFTESCRCWSMEPFGHVRCALWCPDLQRESRRWPPFASTAKWRNDREVKHNNL